MQHNPEEILAFWLEEVGPDGWYKADEGLDTRIRERFADLWAAAGSGALAHWRCCARSALALLILTDQFPRNMFRGQARAFATDALARDVARQAIARGHDQEIAGAARQFFYLPLEHSEMLPDQARAVRLILERMEAPDTLLHARVHREIIRTFGRFPYRNAALGRRSSAAEVAFLEGGGYGELLHRLQAA